MVLFQVIPGLLFKGLPHRVLRAGLIEEFLQVPVQGAHFASGIHGMVGGADLAQTGGAHELEEAQAGFAIGRPLKILDEATANVDPEDEKELMEAIDELTREKTVIMIAHRLKTIRHAHQILVVDNGRIVQRGTHDELMTQSGIYRRFIHTREQAVGWKL